MEDNQLEVTDIGEHIKNTHDKNDDESGLDILVDGQTPGEFSDNKNTIKAKNKATHKDSKGYDHQYLSVGFIGLGSTMKTTAAKTANKRSKIK